MKILETLGRGGWVGVSGPNSTVGGGVWGGRQPPPQLKPWNAGGVWGGGSPPQLKPVGSEGGWGAGS